MGALENVVTGAFSYTGKYITHRLLAKGEEVRALTGHPERSHPFGNRVGTIPYSFGDPDKFAEDLRGAETLYTTYWIRFPYGGITYEKAVEKTRILVNVAKEAGIRRIVHVSVTNPSLDSALPYFRGKALQERIIRESGLSYAMLRPTLVYGVEDMLVNNMAWFLRRFPVFPVARGSYYVQPVFVGDLADLAVDAEHRKENIIMDAAGPDVFAYSELVALLAKGIGRRARIVSLPASVVYLLAKAMGYLVKDVVLTRGELSGLTASLLVSKNPPTAPTRLTQWLEQNGRELGRGYTSELRRHFDRP